MKNKILIIEDEESILMALEDDLIGEGYEVESVMDGNQGFLKAIENSYDLILLDVMLPGMDGFSICRELRKRQVDMPIIMLTAKSQEIDKVLGLEFGADDYVTKPYSLRELQARIKANLRRKKSDSVYPIREIGPLKLDKSRLEAKFHGKSLDLTHIEFMLLFFFIENEGIVLDRQHILDKVWGKEVLVGTRTIDTHIVNLRKKLVQTRSDHTWIKSIRGVGYTFVRPKFDKT